MLDMQKRDYETREYKPYQTPKAWICPLTTFMSEIVNCTSCGKKGEFGEYYTSMTIHTSIGFGYPVCDSCYDMEMKDRKEHE